VVFLGEDGALSIDQGGYSYIGSASFLAPANSPCALTIMNPNGHNLAISINGTNVSSYSLAFTSGSQSSYQPVGKSYNLNSQTRIAKFFIGSTADSSVVAKLIWSESTAVSGTILNYIPITTLSTTSTIRVTVPDSLDPLKKKSAIYFEISTVLLGCMLSMLNL